MKTKQLLFISIVLIFSACAKQAKKQLVIFYTADEHGWMADNDKADGAAAMLQLWKEKEGFTLASDSFLVLSGGDMWTGASVSTLFKGQSMFQVMQAMGYDATALGNHEFDFTLDTLKARGQRSAFPFLAANVQNLQGKVPCFLKPWHIIERNGVKVGLLGLANTETPNTSSPTATQHFSFLPYGETLQRYVPELEAAGADMIIVVGHICQDEMESLVPMASAFNIPIITGGHCHKEVLQELDGVLMIESESYMRSYIKVVVEYDPKSDLTRVVSSEVVKNVSNKKDDNLQSDIAKWEVKANESLEIPIAYTSTGIARTSFMMGQLVVEAWLQSMGDADVAITNAGGIRQDIEKGSVSIGDILGLLPFNNELLKLHVTGAQMYDFISRLPVCKESYIWGGLSPNAKFEPNKVYTLITTDFLYALSETQFKRYDDNPYFSGMLYREPVIAFLEALNSSPEKPLELILQ